jgi:hypothetical protein
MLLSPALTMHVCNARIVDGTAMIQQQLPIYADVFTRREAALSAAQLTACATRPASFATTGPMPPAAVGAGHRRCRATAAQQTDCRARPSSAITADGMNCNFVS